MAPGTALVQKRHGLKNPAEAEGITVVVGGEADICRRALQAGADGIVVDSEIDTALGATARSVCANQVCIPRDMRRRLEKPVLSYRERQILGMVIMGFTNMEIAKRLYLAESTIKSHLSSAFSKLGVRSRNEASALILDPSQALGTGILAITDDERPNIGSRP
jgi:DNA-binding NarL/FixJ family response regulator